MLVFARKDSEGILFSNGKRTVRCVVRCQDHVLKLYQSKRLVLTLETPQDRVEVKICGYIVRVCLVRFRSDDDVTVGFEASQSLRIIREELIG